MASERQLATNRANSRASTGPRSAAGKKRASRNALKHGLNTPMSGAEFARKTAALAGQIAGITTDPLRMAKTSVTRQKSYVAPWSSDVLQGHMSSHEQVST